MSRGTGFDFQARTNEPVVEVSRWFKAPPPLVFGAWTSPEHVCRWWGRPTLTPIACDVDLRVGGSYRYVLQAPDGHAYSLNGRFVEIDPPRRLVTNFHVELVPDDEVVEVTSFDDASGGTVVHIVSLHRSCAARDAQLASGSLPEAMIEQFARLDDVLARPASV